ncbi:rRNA pseudouridine synthase [Candidatus Saccharibacteria bacterium]|nr:rRNA pseudouridine synthase [Candidatus Saccharibacteria bacterium]MCL1963260.1 rRNA pseudouridine synthase [Candidatus Saccharibacteria bacterium]
MRLNKFIASATSKSRREADDLIAAGRVLIDGVVANLGARVPENAEVFLDGRRLAIPAGRTLIALNKPVGYVSSRRAQAKDARTLYELLPAEYRALKTVGRLDRDSSGLILLTDDGDLAFQMTHPKFVKTKIYLVQIDKALEPLHQQMISDFGIDLPDGRSKLTLEKMNDDRKSWRVIMHEGRNRQIRRTFAALGYAVTKLHRTDFGNYSLENLKPGEYRVIESSK